MARRKGPPAPPALPTAAKPAPLIPDEIRARRQQDLERADRLARDAADAQQARERLVRAGRAVADLGREYELENPRADEGYLRPWVAAIAAYSALAPSWPNPRVAPPPYPVCVSDAWQPAANLFRAAEEDPDSVVAALADLATTDPGLARAVARWLRLGIPAVCEGSWGGPTIPKAAEELGGPGPAPPTGEAARPHQVKKAVDKKKAARNAWIYKQCCQTDPLLRFRDIVTKLTAICKRKGWEPIESIQGIKAAARRHAEDNELAPPPRRQGVE